MADTDVVKHDLKKTLNTTEMNWKEYTEHVPFPDGQTHPSFETGGLNYTPPVTTRVTAEELTTAPYRSIGKMGVVIGGGKKTASGWVVARRAVITAGHCVFHPDFGGWITQAGFAPRYNNGVDTAFTVATVYTLKGWVDSKNSIYDMAACVVTANFEATEPPLPFDTGILPGLNFTAIGYPIRPIAGHDFNGERMWKCVGDLIRTEGGLQYAVNNLTGGSSGGPWCETGTSNMIVSGINSYRARDPNVARSPLFVNGFQKLYDAVKDF